MFGIESGFPADHKKKQILTKWKIEIGKIEKIQIY